MINSKCLSIPIGLHCAPDDGKIIHIHSDGTWWFWDETWCNEEGPYLSEDEATIFCTKYAEEFLGI